MSERAGEPDPHAAPAVPCPREVWRAAITDRRVALCIQTHHGGEMTLTGRVTERRKVGGPHHTHVTVQMVPDGDLAPVEIEAERSRGAWGDFQAFQWSATRRGDGDHAFQWMGRVTGLDIIGGRWNRGRVDDAASADSEVTG